MSETQIVKDCLEYLTARGYTVWRNNSGMMKRGGRFIRFGKKGSPDIVGHTREGVAIYCETKLPGEKRSKEQADFALNAIACHCAYVLAESVDDLILAGL